MRHLGRHLVVWLTLGVGAVPALAAETGSITGTVDRPGEVTAVAAIDRESNQRFPGKVDPKSGAFTIDGLPLGAAYDCVVDLQSGRLEGVNLAVPRSDYEKEQPLSKEDVEAIKKVALSLNQFEDRVDVLTVTGNIQHAAVVLNKLRTKPFYGSQEGEVIWRLEVWHFQRPDETWIKDPEELGVVFYRERLQKSAYEKKALTLDPRLGGVKLSGERPKADIGRITLPGREAGVHVREASGGHPEE